MYILVHIHRKQALTLSRDEIKFSKLANFQTKMLKVKWHALIKKENEHSSLMLK